MKDPDSLLPSRLVRSAAPYLLKIIRRFSEEYFQLIRTNSIAENQVLSSQRDNEEPLISLRGQAYLIK